MRNDDAFQRTVMFFRQLSSGYSVVLLLPDDYHTPESQLDSLIHYTGAHVVFGYNQPCYDRQRDTIFMPHRDQFRRSAHRFYEVMCHELVHWSGLRLGRQFNTGNAKQDYDLEEFVAQYGSSLLLARHGLKVGLLEASYFAGYSATQEVAEQRLEQARGYAEKAADFLMDLAARNRQRG